MTHQVLYRKHRPKDFKEVVGQQHVITALTNSVNSGRVAHAYLFSGPRGVGKTTVARILAKALNCLERGKPCNTCSSCEKFNKGQAINLVEIDAASNRGIDEIRDLREGVKFVPAEGKYKVYVIDECHQLTKEAFNALLKTLEEPPAHAVFVLATTEIEKVLPTIISRTQRYDFRRPNVQQIIMRLEQVAKKENVILDKDAAQIVALAAEGSLRDAESVLGQVMTVENKKITRSDVENILGIPKREAAKKMFELVANRNTAGALSLIQELHEGGYDLNYFSKLLLQFFRHAVFLKTDPSLKRFVEQDLLPDEVDCISKNLAGLSPEHLSRAVSLMHENMQSFRKSHLPQLPLEVTVVELTTSVAQKN